MSSYFTGDTEALTAAKREVWVRLTKAGKEIPNFEDSARGLNGCVHVVDKDAADLYREVLKERGIKFTEHDTRPSGGVSSWIRGS